MLVTDFGIVIAVRAEQLWKAEVPIVVTADPWKVTDVSLIHPCKADAPRLVTAAGSVIAVSLGQSLKAEAPIVVTADPWKVTVARLVHVWNADAAIPTADAGIITATISGLLFQPVTTLELSIEAVYVTATLELKIAPILLVNEDGVVTAVSLEQFTKADAPIVVRAFPEKVTDVRAIQL